MEKPHRLKILGQRVLINKTGAISFPGGKATEPEKAQIRKYLIDEGFLPEDAEDCEAWPYPEAFEKGLPDCLVEKPKITVRYRDGSVELYSAETVEVINYDRDRGTAHFKIHGKKVRLKGIEAVLFG
jgi:hypothetical protein